MLNPMMSDGITSGVNWTRLYTPPTLFESAATSFVLPTPGTSSMRTCPRDNSAAISFTIVVRFPIMTFSIFATSAFTFGLVMFSMFVEPFCF
jgi:hypothetical protein